MQFVYGSRCSWHRRVTFYKNPAVTIVLRYEDRAIDPRIEKPSLGSMPRSIDRTPPIGLRRARFRSLEKSPLPALG